jgi:hypothetical protein
MATLQSPGVSVTVVDESFYTPAEPGTTPLIIVATAQDKLNGAGTSTASGTTKANAGQAFKMTSQKDLVDTFGVPFFEKTASSNPIHGGERNEYGLLAAYSLLGVSNAAFIVRADVDLAQLKGSANAREQCQMMAHGGLIHKLQFGEFKSGTAMQLVQLADKNSLQKAQLF